MSQSNKFWEVIRKRPGLRADRNFGSIWAANADNALIRFLYMKGVEAMIGNDGEIVYANPHNKDVWGRREGWTVKVREAVTNDNTKRRELEIEEVRERAGDSWL